MATTDAAPLVLAPYGRAGGSSRVRVYDWLDHLGVDLPVMPYAGTRDNRPRTLAAAPTRVAAAEARLRDPRLGRGRTVLLHREASPFSRGRLETRLMRRAQRSVYDFDDALQWDHGGRGPRAMFPKSVKCTAAVREADVVIAGNPVLAEWAARWSRDVIVIPSCVEPEDYIVKRSHEIPGPPTLVWIGSPSAEGQLRVAAPGLLEVRRRTGATLKVVSAGSADLGPLEEMVERVAWSPAVAAEAVTSADIGIAPLFDGPCERGKCAYKLLQYGASGLPVVGTPVGANATVLGEFGAPAVTDTQAWVDAVLGLIEGPERERALAGARARDVVCARYSFAAWAPVWCAAVGLRRRGAVTAAGERP